MLAKRVLLDTGFWFALYDRRDRHYGVAGRLAESIFACQVILPWPSLYETLNTRFVRRIDWLASFRLLIGRRNVSKLEDGVYRERALAQALATGRTEGSLSLVDRVIREMLADRSVRVDALVTFNRPDFADVCAKRKIQILDT